MGSRGMAIKGKKGGFKQYNYHTVLRINKFRFVMQNKSVTGRVKLPEMSNTPWAKYVTLNADGRLKSVTLFNGNRRKYLEIDFDKPHNKISPHAHDCNPKTSIRNSEGRPLQGKRERDLAAKVIAMYKKHEKQLLEAAK